MVIYANRETVLFVGVALVLAGIGTSRVAKNRAASVLGAFLAIGGTLLVLGGLFLWALP